MNPFLPPLKPNFEAALRDAESKRPASRSAAAEALSSPEEGREEEAKRALRPMLEDEDLTVRYAAIASLGKLKDGYSLARILRAIDDDHPQIAEVAVIAAADIGDPAAFDPLVKAIEDARPQVRFQAVVSLATLDPSRALGPLSEAIEDGDEMVRENLAVALGNIASNLADGPKEDKKGHAKAVSLLARLLEDKAVTVRFQAAFGLAEQGDGRGESDLREGLLGDRGMEAAWALGEIGAKGAADDVAALTQGLFRPLLIKATAGAALARLGDPRGEETLRAMLRAFRSDARSFSVEVVGELRLAALLPELVSLARRPRGADPVTVAEALARFLEEPGSAEAARAALEEMARGGGEGGERARALLDAPRSGKENSEREP